MWTNENRARYDRDGLRYPSDLTDEEWAHIQDEIPPAKRGGNKRTVNEREIVNGLMYILSTGCQWRAIPKDLPPRSTLHDYFGLWEWDGTLERIHHAELDPLLVNLPIPGGELLIPTLILLFGADIKLAGSLSLAVSLPTMLVGFARYSRDRSFVVLNENSRFVLIMTAGPIVGSFIGGRLLGLVPMPVLLPLLAVILVLSAVKVWRHK